MTLSFLWLIAVDYNRPWRGYQDHYYLGKAALAHLDYLDTQREDFQQDLQVARHQLDSAIESRDLARGVEREEIIVERNLAAFNFKKADAPYSRRDQVRKVTVDTYEKVLRRHGAGHALTIAAKKQLDDESSEVETLQQEKEKWEDETKRLDLVLLGIDAEVDSARKRLGELEKTVADAKATDLSYRGVLTDEGILGGLPIVSAIMNMPLGDFAATKNTPARHEVKQLVLPDVRQNLNYLATYTTDRCTTCHIAIDDPAFSRENLARRLESSLPAIEEALTRDNATDSAFAYPSVPASLVAPLGADASERAREAHDTKVAALPGRVVDHWSTLSDTERKVYFSALLAVVNDYFDRTGRKRIELEQPLLAHPDLDLYVSLDSPHPAKTVGCTVCHEGNPQETDFVLAAHSPETHKLRDDWAEKYYISRMGWVGTTFETIDHYWDRHMLLPKYTEAGCAKCHTQVADISDFEGQRKGAQINLGRYLFKSTGCVNCHNDNDLAGSRRVGPDLTHVAEKLTPGFVQQWAWFPQAFNPASNMPHFFMQENTNSKSDDPDDPDPDPVGRTQAEVLSISRYLFAVSQPWTPLAAPEGVTGDVESGRSLFTSLGCLACHTNLSEFGEEWITQDMIQRVGLDQETAGYRYKGMTREERVRYAMEHFVPFQETFFDPDRRRWEEGEAYQPPTFTRFAPELSGIGSKASFEWLYSWLMEPKHYSPDTKMPSFRLSPQEAADVAAYLLTQKNDDFPQEEFALTPERQATVEKMILDILSAQRSVNTSKAILADRGGELGKMIARMLSKSLGEKGAKQLVAGMDLTERQMVFLGSKRITHYGCYACHSIPGFEQASPPGTDLSRWAEKPIGQLDFAFYDHAFEHLRHDQPELFGHVYLEEDEQLNHLSPGENPEEQVTHTHGAFIKHKLLNPRIWDRGKIKKPDDKLKMPNFYFTQDEAEALTTYVLSRVSPRVNEVLQVDYDKDHAGPMARGRDLTRELNCVGCHEAEDNAPTIQQYFRRSIGGELAFDATNAPPSLRGEGAKLQHNWFRQFLANVEMLRPWLRIRMPSFNLSDDEAATLVEYFAALSQQNSADLTSQLDRIDEYLLEVHEAGGSSEEEADWFLQDSLRRPAANLRRFATLRKLMRPADLDMIENSLDKLRDKHKVLLDRVGFIRDLYDAPFPFAEPPQPLSDPPRYESGGRFLEDMGCLKCHVLGNMLAGPATSTDEFVQVYRLDAVLGEGDSAQVVLNGEPYAVGSVIDGHTIISATNVYNETGDVLTTAIVEGPNADGETERVSLKAASAPNLSLTYRRLRRQWVFDWMLSPQLIQPGTKMPQNFSDGKSPFEGMEGYPGTGIDHINLLVDYLFDAGMKGARWPLPKIVLSAPGDDEFDEDNGEDDEFDDF